MAVLNGGGGSGTRWLKFSKMAVGEKVAGAFVSFEAGVEGSFGPEDVLTLEDADGVALKGRCPAALGRVFKNNPNLVPGTGITVTYEGQGKTKAGKMFHSFRVETADEDASFDTAKLSAAPTQQQPSTPTSTIAEKLEAARRRRGAA